ncbi:hypothetical protein [Heyndrickxia acidicola]|uniref:Uncharacterized protein n=1 Tax=Heyndrickxia acidicola TaxID=209389 RepID=A0ABU6MGD7_9BACI|nr:hypothetical protein [Heyndrickxia acidicola]MED1203555.1 hypothetical protein [Heyndrickxia acidicola]
MFNIKETLVELLYGFDDISMSDILTRGKFNPIGVKEIREKRIEKYTPFTPGRKGKCLA